MYSVKRWGWSIGAVLVLSIGLSACSSNEGASVNEGTTQQTAVKETEAAAEKPKTKEYVDYLGRKVEIPTNPQRIVYYDNKTFGDMLVLGADAIGQDGRLLSDTIYEDQVKDIEDLGAPLNLEKLVELQPDLIITGLHAQGDELDQIAKVAPTVGVDVDAPLEERLSVLGLLVNKEKEAQQWLADYEAQSEQAWNEFKKSANIGPDETATVFLNVNRSLYVMTTGLAGDLYSPHGFKIPDEVKKVTIDENLPWAQISLENLPSFAGDHVFLIAAGAGQDSAENDELMKSAIWMDLPAVKNGHVYVVEQKWNKRDAYTMRELLNELPAIMKK
ncbi:ABC transporter substrate-binding protein [Paenibacillus sp. QZ-Y1]|uniref:ABC transporter substrate-binding protein n=1 Tax=Paenibacillus sp. QZ-Y1 TaxID=3414511 RepID=UPI003F78C02B